MRQTLFLTVALLQRRKIEKNKKKLKREKKWKRLKNKIKVLKENGNKSPNRKGKYKSKKKRKIKVQIKYGKMRCDLKKKSFLRPRCKIAVKNDITFGLRWFAK